MINAVVFDFNGVFAESPEKALMEKLCALKGIDPWIAWSNYYVKLWNFEKGRIEPIAFWKTVFPDLTDLEFSTIVVEFYEKPLKRDEEVFFVAEKLAEKMPVYCISNSNFLQGKAYRKKNLYKGFKEFVLSHEIGKMKPFLGIFKYFLEKTGLKANKCLFIDDSRMNIIAAKLLGFKTIRFKDAEQLKERLKKFDIF
ncbi:MAG: hypothetical protein COV47_05155 [Candidatus Diapherotrites archaeon CG11_big_fil_rev_8_21_14_0_20_37_9]|nr:MAG: hypothetical protein COV47_05155 [Candidatus Diapherotrites archaeon CG11_big_fil_rev_8_21_14_0_20_37_9]